MRVLVAEDDASVSAALAAVLGRADHACLRVARGSDVLLQHRDVELVLLDLGLEDMDGLEVLRRLRQVSQVPVIVVTARGDERSTVRALGLGADDYLVKPVRMHELLARIDAVARRRAPESEPEVVHVGEARIELLSRRVAVGDGEVALTPTEFELLAVLAKRVGRAVSRQELLDQVWGDAYAATSRSFDVHLAQLRHRTLERIARGHLISFLLISRSSTSPELVDPPSGVVKTRFSSLQCTSSSSSSLPKTCQLSMR